MKKLSVVFAFALMSTTLVAISSTQASAAATLTTCTNLVTGKTLVITAASGKCRSHMGSAHWIEEKSDSPARTGDGYATMTVCSSKNSLFSYQLIKDACPKFQVTTNYWRTVAAPATPVIEAASARGHDSAALFIKPTTSALSAPVLYYLVTDIGRGEVRRVAPGNLGHLNISGLSSESTYTFTIAAVNVDGSSAASLATPLIRTGTAPVVSTNTPAVLAAPAFTITSSAETKTVNNAIVSYTINSSGGGTVASYSISPAAPAGLTFSTSTGLLSGTPTSVASATAYTITATNASGSATRTFTLTVSAALAAPAFTISSASESKPVNNAIVGYTINSSGGGTVASYSISPSAPAGLTFSTSDGTLSGTPTSVASATAYTITATNASGSATRTFTLTVTAIVYTVGDTGPGGGRIFYVAPVGTTFLCGPTRSATCTYLEAAPADISASIKWAQPTYVGTAVNAPETATATAIGWGYRNTRAIILQGNSDTATSAAALADSYTVTVSSVVYDDWYLPSKDELRELCKFARSQLTGDPTVACNTTSAVTLLYGFADNVYWSSSEAAPDKAWSQSFLRYGSQNEGDKRESRRVRPVRAG